MTLRKGKTKQILESSIDSALLAVEVYNKPRTPFRAENYISLMIIAWTKLFHAHFNNTRGDLYYYKNRKGTRYIKIDGERKAWQLSECIKNYGHLDEAVKTNLKFFIKLRNKIEHRHISTDEVGIDIFGECQALLYNYEKTLIDFFGEEYAINENLAFSLQFSTIRTKEQDEATKKILSRDVRDIRNFIEKYRGELDNEVFNSPEYSIRLLQIPKIVNNDRKNVPAIEFVNWSSLSEEDKEGYEKLMAIVKDKKTKKEAINPGKLKAGNVVDIVKQNTPLKSFNHFDHGYLYYLFSIRPTNSEIQGGEVPFETNTKYCHYDEVHDDYVYQETWPEFISRIINEGKITKEEWRQKTKNKEKLDLKEYE